MRFEKRSLDGLGVEVSGGYRVGIYVIELQENSICKAVGLQVGDRLLKVKNENLFCIVFLSLFYIWCFYKQIIKRWKSLFDVSVMFVREYLLKCLEWRRNLVKAELIYELKFNIRVLHLLPFSLTVTISPEQPWITPHGLFVFYARARISESRLNKY